MNAESPEGRKKAGGRDWENSTFSQESASRWKGGGDSGVEVVSDSGGGPSLRGEARAEGAVGEGSKQQQQQQEKIVGLLSNDLPVGKGGWRKWRQEEKEDEEDSIDFRLELPAGTRGVIINVGSNKDPIQPPV